MWKQQPLGTCPSDQLEPSAPVRGERMLGKLMLFRSDCYPLQKRMEGFRAVREVNYSGEEYERERLPA